MLLQILLGWGKFEICGFAFRDSFFCTIITALRIFIQLQNTTEATFECLLLFPSFFSFFLIFFLKKVPAVKGKDTLHLVSGILNACRAAISSVLCL